MKYKNVRKLTQNPPQRELAACRYGLAEGNKDKHRLYTLANPFAKSDVYGLLQQEDPDERSQIHPYVETIGIVKEKRGTFQKGYLI